MKIILNKLYLTIDECGIKPDTLYKAKQRGTDGFVFVEDPQQGRMICYDTLKDVYKAPLIIKYGKCPKAWFNENGFEASLHPDSAALQYLHNYRSNEGKTLRPDQLQEYSTIASVFNAVLNNRGNLDAALLYMKARNLKPSSQDRFLRKLKEFKAQGAQSIINGRIGNKNAEKAKNLPLLRQLAARPNNFDHALIANDYNQVAVANGLPLLSQSTVYRIATQGETKLQITGQKKGMHAWRNDYDLVIARKRPSQPLLMTVHDGFDWELYYQKVVKDPKGHNVTRHHFRKHVVVVVDAYNDYPLGYAIGEGENAALIKQALKNAALHVYELTGGYHFQWEIKSDNFAGGLAPWYAALAKFHSPSAVGNARDKTIESWFKRFNDKHTIRHHNYAGKNINSLKKNQPNRDFLDKYKHQFPTEEGVIWQIINDIQAERQLKMEDWLTAWSNTPANRRRQMTRADYLQAYGTEREQTIKLTNQGITMQVDGEKYKYMALEHDLMASIGSDIKIVYDPASMDSILAIDEQNQRRWLLNERYLQPMARMDQTEGDRTKLNQLLQFKDQVQQNAITANVNDMGQLESEGMLKGFFTYQGKNKEAMAEAKRALNSGNTTPVSNEVTELENVFVKRGSLKQLED